MFDRSKLFQISEQYKPFEYPWAYDAWVTQQKMHWIAEEVPLSEDTKDWKSKLTTQEKNLLTHIFRLFTQMDVEVCNAYTQLYPQVIKNNEILNMFTAFANMETIHQDAYSKLIDTVGMPEIEYSIFKDYDEMANKCDFLHAQEIDTVENFILTLVIFGAFTEGLQLFASFAILLNFQRFNKMKGMCQIVEFSIKDETLHVESLIKLFHTLLQEYPELNNLKLENKIVMAAQQIVHMEDKFIDLVFEEGDIEGLTKEEVKRYVRFMCNLRLHQLKIPPLFDVPENPLDWITSIVNGVSFTNFFSNRVTEYSKANTKGNWDNVF